MWLERSAHLFCSSGHAVFSAAALGPSAIPKLIHIYLKKTKVYRRGTVHTHALIKNSKILNFKAKNNLHPALVSHFSRHWLSYSKEPPK